MCCVLQAIANNDCVYVDNPELSGSTHYLVLYCCRGYPIEYPTPSHKRNISAFFVLDLNCYNIIHFLIKSRSVKEHPPPRLPDSERLPRV